MGRRGLLLCLFTAPRVLLEPSWHPLDLYLSSRSLECCTQQLGAPALYLLIMTAPRSLNWLAGLMSHSSTEASE
eukprot:3476856-Heterocapsa_arctica.AAC.1